MRLSHLAALIALCLCPLTASAEKAIDILLRHEKQKVEELKAYLQANPKAEDREAAVLFLIDSLTKVGDKMELLTLYEQMFEMMVDQKNVSFPIVQPMANLYAQTGQREKGLQFLYRAGGIFGTKDEGIADMIFAMQQRLKRPLQGETMVLDFVALDGRKVNLAQMKGKVVLVYFWATWYSPCIAEIPVLAEIYKRYQAKGFEMIGINLDSDKEIVEQAIRTHRVTWPQRFSGEGSGDKIAEKYNITTIPTTFLIGKDGKVALTDLSGAQLNQALAKMLGP